MAARARLLCYDMLALQRLDPNRRRRSAYARSCTTGQLTAFNGCTESLFARYANAMQVVVSVVARAREHVARSFARSRGLSPPPGVPLTAALPNEGLGRPRIRSRQSAKTTAFFNGARMRRNRK